MIDRRLAERRFLELANAIREHEASLARERHGRRREDERLYQRLRQISGEPPERPQNQRQDGLTLTERANR